MATSDLLAALLAQKGKDYFDQFSAFMTALLSDNSSILSTAGQAVNSTSTTSLAIGAGTKSLTVAANKAFAIGQPVSLAVTASPTTNVMYGTVTSYDVASGALVVSVSSITGSGTYTAWTVSVVGATGPVGDAGIQASETVAGVIELATQPEVNAGTDTERAVVPSTLAGKLTDAAILQGKHVIPILAGALTPRSTNGPSVGSVETATNKNRVVSLDFDPATAEYAQIAIPMPKSWDEGTVTAQFIASSASGTGGVVFGLRAVAVSPGDSHDAAFGTGQTATVNIGLADSPYASAETAAVTIAGSPAAGDVVWFEFYRDPANGSDTLATDARLEFVNIFYNVNAATEA